VRILFSTLPLSQAEVHDVSCDKEELSEIDSFIPMPLLVHVNDTHALEPYTSAENKVFIPIPSAPDEQKIVVFFKLWVILSLMLFVLLVV